MLSSKSRLKGALLAAVAGAAVSPMVARAQSLSVSLAVSQNGHTYTNNAYIDPYDPVTINVYATITGTTAPSASNVYGLDYLYYNVNAATTTGATGLGNISSAVVSSNFNSTGGTQVGNVSTGLINSTPSTVLGDSSGTVANYINIAKPRSADGTFVLYNAASGVTVSGNSVQYLLETLTYTPNTTAINASPSTKTVPNVTTFNVSIPSVSSPYVGANYMAGTGATLTSYGAATAGITLTDALPGDVNLDGTVNGTDSALVFSHFNKTDASLGVSGASAYAAGDLTESGTINGTDSALVFSHFNQSLGGSPSGISGGPIAGPSALIGANGVASVPEPATLGLLVAGLLPVLGRRRSRA
jgi:hypothetical protein